MNVCVIGLGYIGLPTAALLASRGIQTLGVDIIPSVIETINAKSIHIEEPELDRLVHDAVGSGLLRASLRPQSANVFIITVPTPLTIDNKPDISYIFEASESIAPFLKPGDLVILESTSPVGATQQLKNWIANTRPDLQLPNASTAEPDIAIAYCPERVLPGRILYELVSNDRIIGGLCQYSANKAKIFYEHFVEGTCVTTDASTAEMTKLTENAYRDVNIAFANELSLLCNKNGVNVWELITLANRHPRVNILQPGAGVGGHCIAVDPWFIIANDHHNSKLIQTARHVNENKTKSIIEQVKNVLLNNPNLTIACLGLAFKPDIDDLRESPALQIANEVAHYTNQPTYLVEPHITALPKTMSESKYQLCETKTAIDNADIILLLVKHQYFVERIQWQQLANKVCVIDAIGLFPNKTAYNLKSTKKTVSSS